MMKKWFIIDWTLRETKEEIEAIEAELKKFGHIVEVRRVYNKDSFKYAIYKMR